MKIGIRTPSPKKSISARTTGRAKRTFKRLTNPFYGKKGMGMIKNPKKAIYNKIYRRVTISPWRIGEGLVSAFLYFFLYLPAVLLWVFAKYSILAAVWIVVTVINGIIALAEHIANRNANRAIELE